MNCGWKCSKGKKKDRVRHYINSDLRVLVFIFNFNKLDNLAFLEESRISY